MQIKSCSPMTFLLAIWITFWGVSCNKSENAIPISSGFQHVKNTNEMIIRPCRISAGNDSKSALSPQIINSLYLAFDQDSSTFAELNLNQNYTISIPTSDSIHSFEIILYEPDLINIENCILNFSKHPDSVQIKGIGSKIAHFISDSPHKALTFSVSNENKPLTQKSIKVHSINIYGRGFESQLSECKGHLGEQIKMARLFSNPPTLDFQPDNLLKYSPSKNLSQSLSSNETQGQQIIDSLHWLNPVFWAKNTPNKLSDFSEGKFIFPKFLETWKILDSLYGRPIYQGMTVTNVPKWVQSFRGKTLMGVGFPEEIYPYLFSDLDLLAPTKSVQKTWYEKNPKISFADSPTDTLVFFDSPIFFIPSSISNIAHFRAFTRKKFIQLDGEDRWDWEWEYWAIAFDKSDKAIQAAWINQLDGSYWQTHITLNFANMDYFPNSDNFSFLEHHKFNKSYSFIPDTSIFLQYESYLRVAQTEIEKK